MYIWTVSEIKTLIINSIPYPTPSVDHFIVDSDGRVVSLEGGRLWLAPAVVYVEDHPNNWWCRVNVDSCWRHGHWAAWASDRLDRHKVWLEETLIAGHSGHCWLQGQVSEVKVYDLCLSTTTGRGTDSLITGSAAGLTGATDLKHPTNIYTQMMTDTVLKHPTNICTQMMTDTVLKHPTNIYTQMMTDTVLKHPTNICTQMMTDTVLKHPTNICTQMMTDTVIKHPTNICTQMMTDTVLKHPTNICTQMMTDTVLKHPTNICTQMMTDTVLKHPTNILHRWWQTLF